MKKVGIISLCGNDNFGNKLQNYALLTFLEKKGLDVHSIWIASHTFTKPYKNFLKYIKKTIKDLKKKRNRKFIKFNKFLKYDRKKVIVKNDQYKINKKYDYLIVGSDQVWNPNYIQNYESFLLKGYAKEKSIAYAASFGVNEIPNAVEDEYQKNLQNFKAISVREEKGCEIVKKLTGRKDIEVLVDPTMLLDLNDWNAILKKPKNMIEEPYILLYFLGGISKEKRKNIYDFAKKNNLKIINLLDKEKSFYNCGPREFLYLEKNATLICTDSFHSSVFAILYKRPFLVYDRENLAENKKMNSRLDTLLKKFDLEARKYRDKITEEDLKYEFKNVEKVLEQERKKTNEFIEKAIFK